MEMIRRIVKEAFGMGSSREGFGSAEQYRKEAE